MIGSSPKILPLCPSFYSLYGQIEHEDKSSRIFEASVGIELLRLEGKLYYWRNGDFEVDFIFIWKNKTYAIEVKSGRKKKEGGMNEFLKNFSNSIPIFFTKDNYWSFIKNPEEFLDRISL